MCEQFQVYQKVEIMAQYLRRSRYTEDSPGKCKFCGCDLPSAYIVYDFVENKRYDCKLGTKEAMRAEDIVAGKIGSSKEAGSPFPDLMAWPITMCAAMEDEAIYYQALALLKLQSENRKEEDRQQKTQVFVKAANW